MSKPLFWPGKRYFYAIGNTSAVSLARDVPAEKDLNLLLLGCGDPRNVMFTLLCEPATATRKLDFTCVDFEPAVLARNVLLLSLIMDKKPTEQIFDIFFHLYVDNTALGILVSQCETLVQSSSSLKDWKDSSYGSTLCMSSQHTLTELRGHWEKWAKMHALPEHKLQAVIEKFRAGVAENRARTEGGTSTSARSTGPLMMYGSKPLSECFDNFWKYGTTYSSGPRRSAAIQLNPTFVYTQSGAGCFVHYGTDPVIPFHLAPIFANSSSRLSQAEIMRSVRVQFEQWSGAFQKYHEQSQCFVRFFFADAIFAARAMQLSRVSGIKDTRIPVCQWRTDLITLDREEYQYAPLEFDVVDTSNLDDHLGLMNILVAARPLLKSSGDGVLYLESLLSFSPDGNAPKDLTKRFHADLTVMSVLLCLCPVDYITGYSSRGNVHELASYESSRRATTGLQQYHQTTTWKSVTSIPPSVDPWQFGTFLYDLYHTLFEEEDSQTFWRKNSVNPDPALQQTSLAHYSRESFVLLLKFLRDSFQITKEDWVAVLDRFFSLHTSDTSMKMDTLRFHDLCGLLHYYGVYTMDAYRMGPLPRLGPFKAWPQVPPLVRVFLTVPRDKLTILSGNTPTLEAGMLGPRMCNLFSSIHASYGTLTTVGTPANPKVLFEEDRLGFQGTKPLIVSFAMPAMLLSGFGPGYDSAENISITFHVNSNPANTVAYAQSLGPYLKIHSADLLDKENVVVIPEQPLPGSTSDNHVNPPVCGEIGSQDRVQMHFNEESDLIEQFSAKILVDNGTAKEILQSGVNVIAKQIFFNIVELQLGERTQEIVFPFPISMTNHKLRIARKSLWIEVIIPIRNLSSHQEILDPFPVKVQSLMPWSIHRVNMDCLPVLDLENRNKLGQWLGPHIAGAFSKRELKTKKKKAVDALMFVKDSISSIMMLSAGIQTSACHRVFALRDKVSNNCDTVIFINQLRFDLSCHTVLCDGFVLPLTVERTGKILKDFRKLVPKMQNIGLEAGEISSWKLLLPVLVERCRTWTHLDSCQYKTDGKIPLTTEMEKIPLCACGEGKDVQAMHEVTLWKSLAKYCTRFALSPLFGVSYLEAIGRTDRRCCMCRAKANFTCPKCKQDRYCGQACQKQDWKRHKVVHHDAFEK
ncbi:hypothetical protein FB45DRAFT_150874 [Roridomyces roridus]|uniref:MYND-type domain-containing protein n=1 Tax=Roridomyces roridus TaxID=1738132 RepID=A0AAD7BH49_9AGAR|nr:hypothetical protein FB45DRAFT_150874 [Roridomyces roridus]